LLNCDLIYVESILSEKSKSLEDALTELEYYKTNFANVQDIRLKLQSQVIAYAALVKENEKLSKTIKHEKTIIESWAKASQISYKCATEQIPHQVRAIIGGDLSTAAAVPKIYELDPVFRPKTPFDEPMNECFSKTGTKTEIIKSVPMTLSKMSSSLPSSSNSQGSKKKVFQIDVKNIKTDVLQPFTEVKDRVSQLESQVLFLARQLQSCNTKVSNLQNLSNKPSIKPFSKVSKPSVKTDKKIVLLKKPPNFVPAIKTESDGASTSQTTLVISHQKSTEPISRWVPKNN
jgi:regulator of replication initiation timing